jgi:tRNA 2-thiouridine synthesizing protein E
MTTIKSGEKTVTLDDEGYLTNQKEWDEGVAQALAKHEGLEKLTAEQVEIIRFMREYYGKHNAFPILNYVCKNIKQPRKCVNEEFINPDKAWKIAGLPKLDGIQFVSMDGKNFIMEECC